MTIARATTAAAALAIAVGLAASGCTRKHDSAPVVESGTQTSAQGGNQPATVIGCLRAGEAADTFVLTSAGEQAVTYQLTGAEGEMLRDHVGHQVEVSGHVTAEQRTATRATSTADQTVGTAGTPTVQTQTQVNLRRLEVSSVKPTGSECK